MNGLERELDLVAVEVCLLGAQVRPEYARWPASALLGRESGRARLHERRSTEVPVVDVDEAAVSMIRAGAQLRRLVGSARFVVREAPRTCAPHEYAASPSYSQTLMFPRDTQDLSATVRPLLTSMQSWLVLHGNTQY